MAWKSMSSMRIALLAVAGTLMAMSCGRSSLRDLGLGVQATTGGAGGSGAAGSSSTNPDGTGATTGSGGTGGAHSCMGPDECPDDGDPCTQEVCIDGACQSQLLDADGDGFPPTSCDPNGDCNDFNPNVFPGHPEICDDAADNDCNGVADCFDPACANVPDCGCKPNPNGENCNNGKDDDCDTFVDCNDPDCIGTMACSCADHEAGHCTNGFDDDCDGLIDCDDSECQNDPACICQGTGEFCGDGQDNDCDGLIDCADPDCKGVFPCACQPPGVPENCSDGQDNDCDGVVDCADPDCLASPACQMCTAEICNDGKDNNCDGKIDCADPACFFAPNCAPQPEICNNHVDDDHDGKIDCDDPDCKNNPLCVKEQSNCLTAKLISASGSYTGDTTGHVSNTTGSCGGSAGEAVFYFVLTSPSRVHLDTIGTSFDSVLYVRAGSCTGGKELGCDDDSGGSWAALLDFGGSCKDNPHAKPILYPGTYYVFVDGYTVDPQLGPNEGPFVLNIDITPNASEICDDGCDNDGDIYVDCADPDCQMVGKCATCRLGGPAQPEFGVGACTNGIDDDCDGTTDCADDDCSASDWYVTECCDGDDDNGNGIIDDFNCRCHSDADCEAGQICYTHSVFACGIPCTSFFGDVCPNIAPGSFCNPTTQQCEF